MIEMVDVRLDHPRGCDAPGKAPLVAEANLQVARGEVVMIVGAAAKLMMQGYPRGPKADPTKPYVMWAGTPYEHLMLPVQ